jgi:Cap4 SAVED domain
MALFDKWCETAKKQNKRKHLWSLTERTGGRQLTEDPLVQAVRSHYDSQERIADTVQSLGYEKASRILRERLPRTLRARSGDFGEILATELVEESLGFTIPIRRLRYKDGREMALRGDDFIGIGFDKCRISSVEAQAISWVGDHSIS